MATLVDLLWPAGSSYDRLIKMAMGSGMCPTGSVLSRRAVDRRPLMKQVVGAEITPASFSEIKGGL